MSYTRQTDDGRLRSNVLMHGVSGSAAGGCNETTADLLAYAEVFRSGHISDVESSKDMGIAGGAPGINSVLEQNGLWTVIVFSNLDPPVGEDIGRSLLMTWLMDGQRPLSVTERHSAGQAGHLSTC